MIRYSSTFPSHIALQRIELFVRSWPRADCQPRAERAGMLQGCRRDEEWDAQRANTSALALSDDLWPWPLLHLH